MGTIAYKNLTTAELIFKHLVWDIAVKAGEIALETYVPFFALPVIKQFEEGLIERLSNWFFNQFVLAVDVTAIKLVNAAHQAAYDSESLKLKVVALEKGVDSPEFIAERENAKKVLSKFTRFGS